MKTAIKTAILLTAAIASTMASAQDYPHHNAPNGYLFLTSSPKGNYFYINLDSIKPQRFINTNSPAKLAIGNFWAWPEGRFNRVVANCDSNTYATVHAGYQGIEQPGTWQPAIDGTVVRVMVDVLCAVAHEGVKPPKGKTL